MMHGQGGSTNAEERREARRLYVSPSPTRDDKIRARYDAGDNPDAIAHDFGLSTARILQIGKRWKPKRRLRRAVTPEPVEPQPVKLTRAEVTDFVAYWQERGYPAPHAFVADARRLWTVLEWIAVTLESRHPEDL